MSKITPEIEIFIESYDYAHFDIAEFIQAIADLRDRPIRLVRLQNPDGLTREEWLMLLRISACVLVLEDEDKIYYRSWTVLWQYHIILHELAHLLYGHTGQQLHSYQELIARLTGSTSGVLYRISFRDGQQQYEADEKEAEAFAYRIDTAIEAAKKDNKRNQSGWFINWS